MTIFWNQGAALAGQTPRRAARRKVEDLAGRTSVMKVETTPHFFTQKVIAMTDRMIGLELGLPVIRTAAGKLDRDRGRQLAAGEALIRLPALVVCGGELEDTDSFKIAIPSTSPADALPIGTQLIFTTHARVDLVATDTSIVFYELPHGTSLNETTLTFVAGDGGVTLTPADGHTLVSAADWQTVTLTKTGSAAWSASGDLAPA
jgi:hypothetical protein